MRTDCLICPIAFDISHVRAPERGPGTVNVPPTFTGPSKTVSPSLLLHSMKPLPDGPPPKSSHESSCVLAD